MIVIVDYGMGNLYSVKKKLDSLGAECLISADPEMILKAKKLILPGVGHFGQAMENLRKLHLIDALNEAVLIKKTPILGICLGMQLMARESSEQRVENADRVILCNEEEQNCIEGGTKNADRVILCNKVEQNCIEGGTKNADRVIHRGELLRGRTREQGLGWFDAHVVRFKIHDTLRFKVPHTGWNTISIKKENPLMNGIQENAEFYFIHSYYMQLIDQNDALNSTNYESEFVSAIAKDNIYGVQYHPEKSHEVGAQIFKNFIQSC